MQPRDGIDLHASYVFNDIDSRTLTNFYFDPDPTPQPTLVGFDGETHTVSSGLGLRPDASVRWYLDGVYTDTRGTFDVSLLEVDGDSFEVIGTGGDTFLGGLDFDACIADVVVEAFLEKEHIDARSDPVAVARILEFAERAKRELSDRSATIVQIDHLTVQPHAPRAITVPIRRARIEELWSPLVDHTLAIVEQNAPLANVLTVPARIKETWTVKCFNAPDATEVLRYKIKPRPEVPPPTP